MGGIVTPVCECGTEFNELYLGGGFMNFTTVCDVPIPCFNCGTIFVRNIFKIEHRCPKCRRKVQFYGRIVKEESGETDYVFSWSYDDNGVMEVFTLC
jgi:hypothetical protein